MKHLMTGAAALLVSGAAAMADTYEITITNTMADELLAPIVVTDAANDGLLFTMNYVTPAAEHQVLTGEPTLVVEAIGEDMTGVVHGMDGPPGVLLAPGKSVSFTFESDANALRIFAMVAPTMVPDNYVSAVADISARDMVELDLARYDIGHDEGTMMNGWVSDMGGSVSIVRK